MKYNLLRSVFHLYLRHFITVPLGAVIIYLHPRLFQTLTGEWQFREPYEWVVSAAVLTTIHFVLLIHVSTKSKKIAIEMGRALKHFHRFFVGSILFYAITAVGVALFALPGIYFMAAFSPALVYLAKGHPITSAVKSAFLKTKRRQLSLFIFYFISLGVTVAPGLVGSTEFEPDLALELYCAFFFFPVGFVFLPVALSQR